jgi:glycosyltransferase involved in cell wall biosynthesis
LQTLSIVVPVYLGASYIRALVSEVSKLKMQLQDNSEVISLTKLIFVDDSAIDRSPEILDEISAEYEWVHVTHLSRNYGQHAATIAGILHTEEDWVVTMDEDLQHPPKNIPSLLLEAVQHHCDIVYGRPVAAVHQSAFRDWSSRALKYLIEWSTGEKHIRLANSFRLVRGSVARAAAQSGAHDTYLDASLFWFTQRIRSVDMPLTDQRYITTGKSGYRLRSLLSHARRLLISSQVKLLRVGGLFGISVALLSLVVGLSIFAMRILAPHLIIAPGWASLMVTIMFFSGTILFLTGIVLEYIAVILARSNGRPLFFEIDRSGDDEVAVFLARRQQKLADA